MKTEHTPPPKYGYEEISEKWSDAINLGFRYAVRTLDPLTNKINPCVLDRITRLLILAMIDNGTPADEAVRLVLRS